MMLMGLVFLGNNGLGIMDYFNVKKVDTTNLIYIATLGKSCGIAGAFVMGHETLINFMIQKVELIFIQQRYLHLYVMH